MDNSIEVGGNSRKYVCSCVKQFPSKVQSLIFWTKPVESAIVMVAGFTILLSLGCLSLISVFAYSCIAMLCCTGAARVYYDFVKSKESADSTPFGDWVSKDVDISRERVHDYVNKGLDHSESTLKYMKHVLLIESYVDSLKFALCMYLLSILGGFFNLITLLVIGFTLLFSVPKVYDLYHPQIDKATDRAKEEFNKYWSKCQVYLEKIPMFRKEKAN